MENSLGIITSSSLSASLYSKHKGLATKSCEAIIIEALKEHHVLSRLQIDELLWHTLSDKLSDKQKRNRIYYILQKMRGKTIENASAGRVSEYRLIDKMKGK